MERTLGQHTEQLQQGLPADCSWHELSPRQKLALATFHDTCSCLRRRVWEEHPFEALPYGEDLDWGARVVQAGYKIIFEPEAVVHHSHDRSSWYELKRAYADHELVMRLFGYHAFPRLRGVIKASIAGSWFVVRSILKDPTSLFEKTALLLRAPVVITARHFGGYIGARAAKQVSKGRFWKGIDSLMRKGV
jgi:rhamnosyltransferase